MEDNSCMNLIHNIDYDVDSLIIECGHFVLPLKERFIQVPTNLILSIQSTIEIEFPINLINYYSVVVKRQRTLGATAFQYL